LPELVDVLLLLQIPWEGSRSVKGVGPARESNPQSFRGGFTNRSLPLAAVVASEHKVAVSELPRNSQTRSPI